MAFFASIQNINAREVCARARRDTEPRAAVFADRGGGTLVRKQYTLQFPAGKISYEQTFSQVNKYTTLSVKCTRGDFVRDWTQNVVTILVVHDDDSLCIESTRHRHTRF